MRIVVQRVNSASCTIRGEIFSSINKGYLLLIGFGLDDNESDINKLAQKVSKLRIFEDDDQKMNKSIIDVDGEVLAISQFTLYADTTRGNRPSFTPSLCSDLASRYYDRFVEELNGLGISTKKGVFQEDMKIELVNDGPCTIILDSREAKNG